MKSLFSKFCLAAYLISILIFIFLAMKITGVRSKCTKEKAKISRLVSEIKGLKDENSRLLIEFYREVRPSVVDVRTKDMNTLHESGVKYLK